MLVLIFIIFANSFLGLMILLRNPRSTTNRLFFALVICCILWMISSFLTDNAPIEQRLWWGKLAFVFPIFVTLCLALLSKVFPINTKSSKNLPIKLFGLAAVGVIISLTDLVVNGMQVKANGTDLTPGPLYFGFVIIIVLILAYAIRNQIKTRGILTKSQKVQSQLIITGFVLGFLWVLATNVLLPLVQASWQTTNIGPFGTVIFIAFTAYAIIRYRMFDIRYVVFRLLAYTVSLSIIVLLFILAAFNLTTILFSGQFVPFDLQIYYVITAVIVALLFGPIKKLVDRISNRLFFQQSYSAHGAVEKISNFSTRSVDPYSIQQHSLRVFEDTIRPEYAGFIMFNSDGKLELAANIGKYPTKSLELSGFLSELSKIHHKNILADEAKDSKSHMKEYFELSHIGLITRLATNNKSIGYVVLGDKKNGNAYNAHDLQFLTLTANDLALALQNAQRYEEIQAFNETLQEKVNEATSALKRTNAKLVALDDIKDEFISMTSHQLRTPLTSIKGYISMMLEGDLGKINPTQRQALEEAFNSSQRMVFLISDFLNVSRIRTGKFTIERSETDLKQIVTEEIAQSQDIAGLRDQTINYKASKDFPIVLLDEAKTRQVMMNLIDNAIFYTPKNGRIDISLTSNDKEIVFEITDTGIGVPKNAQHRLFTKFFRAENARKARPDGTGLGLFMAQKIIDIQGGKIIFKSIENEGSTFGFRFPLKIVLVVDQATA